MSWPHKWLAISTGLFIVRSNETNCSLSWYLVCNLYRHTYQVLDCVVLRDYTHPCYFCVLHIFVLYLQFCMFTSCQWTGFQFFVTIFFNWIINCEIEWENFKQIVLSLGLITHVTFVYCIYFVLLLCIAYICHICITFVYSIYLYLQFFMFTLCQWIGFNHFFFQLEYQLWVRSKRNFKQIVLSLDNPCYLCIAYKFVCSLHVSELAFNFLLHFFFKKYPL